MLKIVTNFVLGSKQSSTYPSGYACGFVAPAAALDGHFEHPGEPKMQSAKLGNRSAILNFNFFILHCEANI
jgi:hypothetical protein